MTDMQRYGARGPLSDPPQLGEYEVVLAWQAEAAIAAVIDAQVKEIAEYVTAIAAAEQRGYNRAVNDRETSEFLLGKRMGQRDMLAKCIALGDSHITRINNEAEFETVGRAEELFANADGIEFFVGELLALQEKP